MKEYQIRPKTIFEKYLSLATLDAKNIFGKAKCRTINCPACGKKGKFFFKKINFSYYECGKCKTFYVNPRPEAKYFTRYYTNSKSSKFWTTDFYKKTLFARKSKIWKPKSKLVSKFIKFEKNINNIIDIGAGYGLFLDEIRKLHKIKTYALEPSKNFIDICKKKKHFVIQAFIEKVEINRLPKGKNFYTCFELFEHLNNPKIFINKLYNLMKKGEILFMTTLSGTGLDIKLLGKNSKSVQPPYHINFFNPNSIRIFLKKNNFKIIHISTPGKLDIDILQNNKLDIHDNFWREFINNASNSEKKTMQTFLQKNMLSSHMLIVCKKI